jgi:hypothetical protein
MPESLGEEVPRSVLKADDCTGLAVASASFAGTVCARRGDNRWVMEDGEEMVLMRMPGYVPVRVEMI